jgi:hypothetical protein
MVLTEPGLDECRSGGVQQLSEGVTSLCVCGPQVLEWIGVTVRLNMGRGKMQIDPRRNASHGFFANLTAVLLKLCEPFLDPVGGPGVARIDLAYLTQVCGRELHRFLAGWRVREVEGAQCGLSGGEREI